MFFEELSVYENDDKSLLMKEILIEILKHTNINISFSMPDGTDFEKIIQSELYDTLNRIRTIIQDGALDDAECFEKIEEIIRLFEEKGIDCDARHDF